MSFTWLRSAPAKVDIAQCCTALGFFFHVMLGRTKLRSPHGAYPAPERQPVVLGTKEVVIVLAHAQCTLCGRVF